MQFMNDNKYKPSWLGNSMITVDEIQVYEYKTTKDLLLVFVIKMIIYRMNFKPENLILETFSSFAGSIIQSL